MTDSERRGYMIARVHYLQDKLKSGEGDQYVVSCQLLEAKAILLNLWGIESQDYGAVDYGLWSRPTYIEAAVIKRAWGYDSNTAMHIAALCREADRIGGEVLINAPGGFGGRYKLRKAAEWGEVKSCLMVLYGYDLIEDRRCE